VGWWQRADAQGVTRRWQGGGLVAGRRLFGGGLVVEEWAEGGGMVVGRRCASSG